MLLGFAWRVLLARYFTQSEYGIFSLAVILLNVFVTISTLGIQEGATRQIAYYRGKNDASKVKGIVLSSVQIALIASIILSLTLFLTSNLISTKIFRTIELSTALKILSIAIPFLALIHILTSVFRGFGKVEPMVYFQALLTNGLFPLFLVPIILLGMPFLNTIYAFLASIVLACLSFVIYTIKKTPLAVSFTREKASTGVNPLGKELLFFSLPLLGVIMLNMIMQWTDTIMLGYLKLPEDVGLYNVALPLARLILLPLASMGFIYVPVISQLFSQNLTEEMKRSYQVLTKWIFSLSFPLFLILFFFPEVSLNFLFGPRYTSASLALRILSVGLIFHTFLGPNGLTLMIMGKTRLLMWVSLITASLNITLNIGLIPLWGITGAALASLISYFAINIFCSAKLYHLSRIHPFTKSYLKPIIASSMVMVVIYAVASHSLLVAWWMLPLFFILSIVIYGLSLLLTKGLDHEDINMLLAIEKRTGIKATLIKRILKRFI